MYSGLKFDKSIHFSVSSCALSHSYAQVVFVVVFLQALVAENPEGVVQHGSAAPTEHLQFGFLTAACSVSARVCVAGKGKQRLSNFVKIVLALWKGLWVPLSSARTTLRELLSHPLLCKLRNSSLIHLLRDQTLESYRQIQKL